jgi:hypothetical protein
VADKSARGRRGGDERGFQRPAVVGGRVKRCLFPRGLGVHRAERGMLTRAIGALAIRSPATKGRFRRGRHGLIAGARVRVVINLPRLVIDGNLLERAEAFSEQYPDTMAWWRERRARCTCRGRRARCACRRPRALAASTPGQQRPAPNRQVRGAGSAQPMRGREINGKLVGGRCSTGEE